MHHRFAFVAKPPCDTAAFDFSSRWSSGVEQHVSLSKHQKKAAWPQGERRCIDALQKLCQFRSHSLMSAANAFALKGSPVACSVR